MKLGNIFNIIFLISLVLMIVFPNLHNEIFVVYLTLFVFKIKKYGYKRTGYEKYIILVSLAFFISSLGQDDPKILTNIFRVIKIFLLYVFILQFELDKKIKDNLIYLIFIIGIYGLFRVRFFPVEVGYARPYSYMSFVFDSSVVAFTGFIFSTMEFFNEKIWKRQVLSFIGAGIFLYLIIIAQVRATYLAVAIITPVIILNKVKNKKNVIAIMLSILILSGVLSKSKNKVINKYLIRYESIANIEDNASNLARICYWKGSLKVFKEHPVKGIGYKRFNKSNYNLENKKFEKSFAHAHNEYFGILAETGIIGFITWILLKLKILTVLWKNRKDKYIEFLLYSFLGFEIHNMFQVYLNSRYAYVYIILLLGVGGKNLIIEKKIANQKIG